VVAAPIGITSPQARPAGERDARTVRFAVAGRGAAILDRAAARARQSGVELDILGGSDLAAIDQADVVVVLDWPPPAGPPPAAVAAMAAGRAVIVLETLVTAAWPALDPQTWTPRGPGTMAPVAVSLDPRDEEHSLMLAIVRLARDAQLRAGLGAAARVWWQANATIPHALDAWRRILSLPALPPPPAFEAADGADHARGVLAAFGVDVDFL
jgi:hypothetical protein